MEARAGRELTGPRSGEPVLSYLIEFASVLLNRYEVAKDGKTAYERLRGKKSKLLGLEFGEVVQWRRAIKGDRKNKLDTVWRDGYFAGYRTLSGETIISTKEGIYRTRTVRRVPENVRWDAKIYEEFVLPFGK